MGKKKFDTGTITINDKDRYAYKIVKCCDKNGNDLKFDYFCHDIYAIIRLIIPEEAIIVTPSNIIIETRSRSDLFVKRRCNKLYFDRVMSYFYITNTIHGGPTIARIYTKDLDRFLKDEHSDRSLIEYHSYYRNFIENYHIITYKQNTLIKPAEGYLDMDVSKECACGLHFFFTLKELYNYLDYLI